MEREVKDGLAAIQAEMAAAAWVQAKVAAVRAMAVWAAVATQAAATERGMEGTRHRPAALHSRRGTLAIVHRNPTPTNHSGGPRTSSRKLLGWTSMRGRPRTNNHWC